MPLKLFSLNIMDSVTHSFKGTLQYGTKFVWKIQKFSELSEKYRIIKTKEIFLRENCVNKWKIVLEFRPPIMYLGLQYCGGFPHKATVLANITLRNSKETVFTERTLQETFSTENELKFCGDFMYEPSNSMTSNGDQDRKFRLCKDDVLVLEGRIISNCCEPNRSQCAELLQNLRSSLLKDKFSDIQFVIDGEIIPAHKTILSSKSLVFQRMFETNMREKRENKVILTDINKTVFKTFLTFLYTGVLEDFKISKIIEMYYVADKYNVESLAEKCRDVLFSDMSINNIDDILLLAKKHEEHHLYNSALHHFCGYFKYIEPSKKWEKFKETNPVIAAEIEDIALSLCDVRINRSFS